MEVGHKKVTLQDIAERFEVSRSAVRVRLGIPRAFLILQPRRSKAMTSKTPPKLFLSYAHGSQEHEVRVVDLGEKLCHNGVDVIADFWNLRAGHDLHKFMEQMASEVGKVLIVSDKNYAQKADGRQGGVGAESEIIAPNLIGKSNQEKFAALVIEKDDDGNFCLPAYMRSRVCIDYTDPNKQPEAFEKILRWVFDKPLRQKPALGSLPSFALGEDSGIATPSLARVSEVCAALESNQGNAMMRAEDFIEEFARDIAQYQVPHDDDYKVFADKIDESIRALLAPRNAALEVVSRIIRSVESSEIRSRVAASLRIALSPHYPQNKCARTGIRN